MTVFFLSNGVLNQNLKSSSFIIYQASIAIKFPLSEKLIEPYLRTINDKLQRAVQ